MGLVVQPLRFKVSGDQFEVRDDGAAGLMQWVVTVRNLVRGRRPAVISKGRIVSVDDERLVLSFEQWGSIKTHPRGELVFVRLEKGGLDRRMAALRERVESRELKRGEDSGFRNQESGISAVERWSRLAGG